MIATCVALGIVVIGMGRKQHFLILINSKRKISHYSLRLIKLKQVSNS